MSESPGDLLRRAAEDMKEKHGPLHERHVMWRRLAALSREAADVYDVARAYLGEV